MRPEGLYECAMRRRSCESGREPIWRVGVLRYTDCWKRLARRNHPWEAPVAEAVGLFPDHGCVSGGPLRGLEEERRCGVGLPTLHRPLIRTSLAIYASPGGLGVRYDGVAGREPGDTVCL